MLQIFDLIRFKTTSKVGKYIYIDSLKRKIKIPRETFLENIIKSQVYDFEELIDFHIIAEDGIFISRRPSYSCEVMEVKVMLKDCNRYIPLITNPVRKDSRKYKKAYKKLQEIVSTLQFIKMANEHFVV